MKILNLFFLIFISNSFLFQIHLFQISDKYIIGIFDEIRGKNLYF